jgi:hypothetical protein
VRDYLAEVGPGPEQIRHATVQALGYLNQLPAVKQVEFSNPATRVVWRTAMPALARNAKTLTDVIAASMDEGHKSGSVASIVDLSFGTDRLPADAGPRFIAALLKIDMRIAFAYEATKTGYKCLSFDLLNDADELLVSLEIVRDEGTMWQVELPSFYYARADAASRTHSQLSTTATAANGQRQRRVLTKYGATFVWVVLQAFVNVPNDEVLANVPADPPATRRERALDELAHSLSLTDAWMGGDGTDSVDLRFNTDGARDRFVAATAPNELRREQVDDMVAQHGFYWWIDTKWTNTLAAF